MPHILIDSRDRATGTSTDFTVNLNNIYQNRQTSSHQVAVKAIELPYTWYNIRAGVNVRYTHTFSNSSTKIINIPIGNPSVSTVTSNLVTQLNVNTAGDVYSILVNNTTAKLIISENASRLFSFSFDLDPLTHKILGFNKQVYSGFSTYTSNNVLDVSPEKFLLLKSSISLKSSYDWDSFTKNNSNTIMKIPINSSFFSNIIYEPPSTFMRECDIISNSVEFKLTHDDGTIVDLNGADFSFTLIYI